MKGIIVGALITGVVVGGNCGARPLPLLEAPITLVAATINQGETYENDKAWTNRIERGACSRLRDRRTDAAADVAQCTRDQAMQPPCMSYKGFAFAWFDLANDPPVGGDILSFQTNMINSLGSPSSRAETPPYYQSSEFRAVLHSLLRFTLSAKRKSWSTSEQYADYAYKMCMDGKVL